jgi:3-deoxy-D-manno-octulosonic-acid transferase
MPLPGQVYIADTLGELGLFYRLSPFAFIGGSLVPVGGHNLAEAAGLGIPSITGPHTAEILDQVEKLRACGALVQVRDAASLAAAVTAWLDDSSAAQRAGAAAKTAFAGLETLPQRYEDTKILGPARPSRHRAGAGGDNHAADHRQARGKTRFFAGHCSILCGQRDRWWCW